jgi:hypothetical protein
MPSKSTRCDPRLRLLTLFLRCRDKDRRAGVPYRTRHERNGHGLALVYLRCFYRGAEWEGMRTSALMRAAAKRGLTS